MGLFPICRYRARPHPPRVLEIPRPRHVLHEPNSPFRDTVHDYYRHIDEEIGRVFELLTDDTIVLIVLDHGAQRLDGGFCVNEWLVREGLLVLKSYPTAVTPLASSTSTGKRPKSGVKEGTTPASFLTSRGASRGVIEPAEYESFRDQIKAKFEATSGPDGKPLGTLVFKPEQIYQTVKNVPPT